MIQPRYSRLSSFAESSLIRQSLPTGNGFGGSTLNLTQSQELVFAIASSSVSVADYAIPVYIEQPSPFVVEVGKIFVVAIWFWCLIGADFCFSMISTIVRYGAQDI
jgi:hypothetical protein